MYKKKTKNLDLSALWNVTSLLVYFVFKPCYADGMLTKILGVMMLVFCIIFVVIAFKAPQYLFLNMMFVLVFGNFLPYN